MNKTPFFKLKSINSNDFKHPRLLITRNSDSSNVAHSNIFSNTFYRRLCVKSGEVGGFTKGSFNVTFDKPCVCLCTFPIQFSLKWNVENIENVSSLHEILQSTWILINNFAFDRSRWFLICVAVFAFYFAFVITFIGIENVYFIRHWVIQINCNTLHMKVTLNVGVINVRSSN